MYRFVCNHIVPGCTFELEDPDREKLIKEVATHLREHHDLDHRDERIAQALKTGGIGYFRQA
jgi:predicted small metal-binding protein